MDAIEPVDGRPDVRSELKYLLDRSRAIEVGRNSAGLALRETFPSRLVCNIYFDTPELSCYAESLAGFNDRTKLRIRWYGSRENPTSPVLEVKRRRNDVGWKEQAPLSEMNLLESSWRDLHRRVYEQLPGNLKVMFGRLRYPVLINSYERRYYETLDRKLRLTVDSELTFFDQRARSKPNVTFDRHRFEHTMVEIKCSVKNRGRVDEMSNALGLRRVRLSKYCVGVERILGR
jgi:SPX domain protein involved in polyphosphate accumulation